MTSSVASDLIARTFSRRSTLKASAAAAAAAVIAACSQAPAPTAVAPTEAGTGPQLPAIASGETLLTQVLKRGKLIVATTNEYPPMGFVDKDGKLTGFDIGIAKLVAKSMFGDENAVEFKTIAFDARWATIQSGQADFGIMSSTVWYDRVLKVSWTRQYIDSALGVVVSKKSGIKTMADLNKTGNLVAHANIPEETAAIKEYAPNAGELILPSYVEALDAIRTGRAQATIPDLIVGKWLARQEPDTLMVLQETMSYPNRNAIFMRLGDFTWWQVLDTLVWEMRNGSLSSDYDKLHLQWFGEPMPAPNWYFPFHSPLLGPAS